MRVLLTGGSGFVARALAARLAAVPTLDLVVASRGPAPANAPGRWVQLDGTPDINDWRPALAGVEVVIHTAGRAHVLRETDAADALFQAANVQTTAALARQAGEAGVRRFIFLSSIKVNGERTAPGRPFGAEDAPAPVDSYGRSKLAAEQQLQESAAAGGFDAVIVRPPLVYGPGVKANFLKLMGWAARGLPLPLGAVHNRRTLVALENLCDLLHVCIDHPDAPGGVLLAGDSSSLSTAQLYRQLAAACGRRVWLPRIPPGLLRGALGTAGRSALGARLLDSLEVDIDATCRRLDWQPPLAVEVGIAQTVAAWRGGGHS